MLNIAVGCKRIIIDPGYLKALYRPNISINFDGIESLTEEGIKTATGEVIPLDVIILGTGFAFVSTTKSHIFLFLLLTMPVSSFRVI